MLYGHRNDPEGFARCLERFDRFLARLSERLSTEDLLILTADHGNDPTTPSTDHSREYVPYVVAGRSVTPGSSGDVAGFGAIGATVARHLGVEWPYGRPLIDRSSESDAIQA
jgi:phosphopentomutase